MTRRRRAGAAVGAALAMSLLSACGGGSAPTSSGIDLAGTSSAAVATAAATGTQAASPGPTAAAAACPATGFPHLAPELEALLPTSVGGRSLRVWSTRGECWLEQANASLAALAGAGLDVEGIDLDHIAYAVAGRENVSADLPYFVTVLHKPEDLNENLAALWLFCGVLGVKDLDEFTTTASYEQATIGGKQVLVGTTAMLDQDEHLQGAPYLYETEDYLFVILTLDRAWASEAISKLPT